jgi:hypothetical protein
MVALQLQNAQQDYYGYDDYGAGGSGHGTMEYNHEVVYTTDEGQYEPMPTDDNNDPTGCASFPVEAANAAVAEEVVAPTPMDIGMNDYYQSAALINDNATSSVCVPVHHNDHESEEDGGDDENLMFSADATETATGSLTRIRDISPRRKPIRVHEYYKLWHVYDLDVVY